MSSRPLSCIALLAGLLLCSAQIARAWGGNGERLVVNKAVETLPPEIRGFFEANRAYLNRRVTEPLDLFTNNPLTERRNQFIYLDRYGKFPFTALPRNYKEALDKFGKTKLEASGVLPWEIGVYSQKLTNAFREHDWEQARLAAAYLAAYVAQAHDPFHTTENFDGHLSGQAGVDARFGSSLVRRFSTFFLLSPNDATYLSDPTDHAFDTCLSAHAWLDNVLLADFEARKGLSDYTDEYYDRLYNLAGAVVIRELTDAATDVGSFWLTAWINAGRPPLPPAVMPIVNATAFEDSLTALPKAELHVHLEGSIEPATVVELAARYNISLTVEEVAHRYSAGSFAQFIEAFKWITSLLREPADYALITRRFAESLRKQNVLYAEVTLSVGVMLLRKQNPEANFAAIRDAASKVPGIRLAWIFDAVRQFGPNAAMEVARIAAHLRPADVVAFGVGGDELALPTEELRAVYEYAASSGLHRLIHAGETGGPESVRQAIELLGVERIGHGIGVMHDAATMDLLAARGIPLEICPTSNLRTGALAQQLGRDSAGYEAHPLPFFIRRGLAVTLSSDDPAMFETTLSDEYRRALHMGIAPAELLQVAEASFHYAFLPPAEKNALLKAFRSGRTALGLL